ncbi:MAG TPA: type II toxin-antitoxin system RelE/ParE family toxin [Thermoanaerobaculia bacterium]|nr:type II toxin-antitoxin system RelE/ParE family toxin [Thermoanaerobaculia bacterium]
MSRPLHIEVSELAEAQISELDSWWRRNRLKAPNAVREELERVSALIAFQPNIGARTRNLKLAGVRRIHIERIHYDVYYRVVGSPAYLEIVAVWSSWRGTGPPI